MKAMAALTAAAACAGALLLHACEDDSCATSVDDEVLGRLTIAHFPYIVELQPGQSHAFMVGAVQCCYYVEPVAACAEWSVAPTDGATITDDGVLTIDSAVQNGTMFLGG